MSYFSKYEGGIRERKRREIPKRIESKSNKRIASELRVASFEDYRLQLKLKEKERNKKRQEILEKRRKFIRSLLDHTIEVIGYIFGFTILMALIYCIMELLRRYFCALQ